MQRISILVRALLILLAIAATAPPASAFDGCRAADFTADGGVDISDLAFFASKLGTSDPRADLDGGGLVEDADLAMFTSFFGQVCSDCTADLDDDGDVDGDDRTALEGAYGTECRPDLTRDDIIDGDLDLDAFVVYFGGAAPPNSPAARADFNGDGAVDLSDLSFFAANLGNDCRPDLNKDGAVNTNDLWALLASWGTCP